MNTNDRNLDGLQISATISDEVAADRVDLFVTVNGSSLFTGSVALNKAAEVRLLVDAVKQQGIEEGHILLEGVDAQMSSGWLGRSSSATYRLRIRCENLERLPDVLGAITSSKNVTMGRMQWLYPDSAEAMAENLSRCIARAAVLAQASAKALGVTLNGIHSFRELPTGYDRTVVPQGGVAMMSYGEVAASRASVALGFELGNRKTCVTSIEVRYRTE